MKARRVAVAVCVAASLAVPATAHAEGDAPIVITASATAPEFPVSGTEPEIVGTVTDTSGAPLADVAVTLSSTSASVPGAVTEDQSETAADGSFVLAPTPPSGNPDLFETRTFTVTHADLDGAYSAASSAPVVIAAQGRLTNLESSAQRIAPGNNWWTLEGQVSGPSGSLVLGQVKKAGGWQTVTQTTSRPLTAGGLTVQRFTLMFRGLKSGSQQVRAVRAADAYQAEADTVASTVKYGWTPLLGSKKSFTLEQPLVRYDRCRPVTWAFNSQGAPSGALPILKEAFAEAAHYSGYRFRYLGTTREKPSSADSRQRLLSGRGPMVLVKWVKAKGETDLTKGVGGSAGLGGSATSATTRGGGTILFVQKPKGVDLSMGFAPDGWGAIALHELGNVLGLGQVKDRTQVMNPTAVVASQYGAGDAAGLAKLGSARC